MNEIPAFGPWKESDHTGTKQENAIKAARAAKTTPMPGTVDEEKETAVFWGSGKDLYQTSLSSCTCAAFKGSAPCKHIYRLAMELGIIDLPFSTGTPKGELIQTQLKWQDAVDEIEKLPESTQEIIAESLYFDLNGLIECKGEDAEALRGCPLMAEESKNCFRIIDNLTTARKTALRYLRRKLMWDIDPITGITFPCDSAPLGNEMIFYFPNDSVTEELTRRGYNRCLNGFIPEQGDWKQIGLF